MAYTYETSTGTVTIPRRHLSPSSVGLYLTCPMAYWRHYILHQHDFRSVALFIGVAGHDALAATHRHQMQEGKYLTPDEMLDRYIASFEENEEEVEVWGDHTKDTVVKAGKNCLSSYATREMTKHEARAVEMEVTGEIGGIPVLGYVDMVSSACGRTDQGKGGRSAKRPAIIDYKWSGRSRNVGHVRDSIQLLVYSRLTKVRRCGFIRVDPKTSGVIPTITDVGVQHVGWATSVFQGVARSISAGAFPPCDPEAWKCTAKYCGFYDRCRGARQRRLALLIPKRGKKR